MIRGSAVNSLVLEYPGLAVVASRSPATRRQVMATIIVKALIGKDDDATKEKIVVFANATKQLLIREVMAVSIGVKFITLDSASLDDQEFSRLAHAGHLLFDAAGIADNRADSDPHGQSDAPSRIQWSGNPVGVADVLRALNECSTGSTVVIENAHLLHGVADRVSAALTELRNCATATGIFLYIGLGLSHWPDVRKSNKGELFLTDLPENFTAIVNSADKITLLAPNPEGTEVTIFDPRFVEPWRGPLSQTQI